MTTPIIVSKKKRFWSWLVDFLIISMLLSLLGLTNEPWSNVDIFAWITLYLLYFVILTYFVGQTPSQLVFKIRVAEKDSLVKPSFSKIIVRELVALTAATGIGVIVWSLMGPESYWDKASGTIYVKKV